MNITNIFFSVYLAKIRRSMFEDVLNIHSLSVLSLVFIDSLYQGISIELEIENPSSV